MDRAVFTPCHLAWGHTMVGWWRPPPKRLMSACHTSQDCCYQCPWSSGRPLSTHTSARDSQTLTGKSGSVSCVVTATFSWVLKHTRYFFPPPRISVSPVVWKLCNQIPLTFTVRFPEDSQPFCWILRLESLWWGLELLQQWENLFGIIILQFVAYPPSGSIVWLTVTSSNGLMPQAAPLRPAAARAPVPLQVPADLCLHRRHSNTQRRVWLSLL